MGLREDLAEKDNDGLIEIAKGLGLQVPEQAANDELVELIIAVTQPEIKQQVNLVEEYAAAKAEPAKEETNVVELKPHTAIQAAPLPSAPVPEGFPTIESLKLALDAHLRRGLHIIHLDENTWQFKVGVREDSGTMKQPLKTIVQCANLLLMPVAQPTLKGRNDR